MKSCRCQLWSWRTICLAEGIWKVHIFRHLFVCFQTSVYTLGEFHKNRNNIIIFSALEYRDLFSLLTQDFNYLLIVIKMSWKCMPLTKNCKNNKSLIFFYTEMKLVYLIPHLRTVSCYCDGSHIWHGNIKVTISHIDVLGFYINILCELTRGSREPVLLTWLL